MKRSVLGRAAIGAFLAIALTVPAGMAGTASASTVEGDRRPLFDFTDAYYRQNGVDSAKLRFRPTGSDGISAIDRAPDANHRNVRMRLTLPAYDLNGDTLFFTVLADMQPAPFTANAAGRRARELAETSPVYVFPVRGGDPLSVGNSRQANMIDMRNGYFSNNPLALWVHVFVNWTDRAFNTALGRATLARLAERNGLVLDGTPIIRTKSELDELTEARLVTQRRIPTTQAGRWFVCPVFKDPRDGAIAADAFLATVRRADGTPLPAERHFVREFESLRTTGDWPD